MTKILVVSEALGEPNHKRGIFHFTRELIRSLAGDGHELTLLVETTRRYRKLRQRQQRTRLLPDGSRLIELLALYRFLDEADMNAPVMRSSGGLRRTVDWFRSKLRAATSLEFAVSFLRAVHLLPAGVSLIDNHADGLEYIPTDLRHLRLFGDFLLEPGFYSYQDTSALLRLPPPRVDARGYDVILVDTPTRVAIQRKRGAKVICVVHDLLPLTDLKLSDVATRLFLSRLFTSLQQADELAFVSNYSLGRFRALLPQFAHLPARVVYPRARFDAQALPAAGAPSGRPYFVVIVSAEPRKNLAAVIRAFRKLPQADLVVIGYTGAPGLTRNAAPNVRFSGYVEEHEKAALIADAHGLIMPSLAEGFGVPIIEALAVNTPVLCSDIAVFREVAGELADYFDPFSIESIGASVTRVLAEQEQWRNKIRARRTELAERFGHHTQARDLLSHQVVAEAVAAVPAPSVAIAAFNGAAV
ncbi:glycosyltransferase family 4 protein [Bradyrhizobium erythrophlei]|uniref:Glycosyltransferase involved in cell wall bisynthesis n=1 Tax=Bradyrhizobium erythrophlei TaxID=1437360 RepID=A0A1H4MT59_9BRAD|nr:glycosyltransferase family 1 protein [Bradyrhizobium erythrophlei]SEB85838.1 Glycosyltransferase involved in cell wall bisynthesis [Bradyrhizobium erythrophlei]